MLTQAFSFRISSGWAPPVAGTFSKEKTFHLGHHTPGLREVSYVRQGPPGWQDADRALSTAPAQHTSQPSPGSPSAPRDQDAVNPSELELVLSGEGQGVRAQWEMWEPRVGNTQGSPFSPVTSGLGSETQAAR